MTARDIDAATLLRSSARALARLIRAGEVRSRDVCEAHIARIQQVNPALNAVVADRFEDARREADAADEAVRRGPESSLPPLHGVPFTVKESFALRGMPNTSGLVSRRRVVADEDATAVARLRAAGAIPLGVTNVSELCLWMECDNRVWGRTCNAHDVARTSGGSSGGEGAIVAAGGSPFGLAADGGGSIRLPAFFNGVFGHKPSPGLVPNTGQYPILGLNPRLLATGPIARRAEDLDLILSVIAGPDGQDASCSPLSVGDPAGVDPRRLRAIVVEGDGRTRVASDLLRTQQRAAQALAARGCRIVNARVEGLHRAFEMWTAAVADATDKSLAELAGLGAAFNPLAEIGRLLVGRSPFTIPTVGLLALESVGGLLQARVARARTHAVRLEKEMLALLGDDAVLLYPPHPTTAPRHRRPLFFPMRFAFTGLFNVLGLPVTQVPTGMGDEGVPLGVQVASAPGHDERCLAVARWLEDDLGGWRMAEVPPAPLRRSLRGPAAQTPREACAGPRP